MSTHIEERWHDKAMSSFSYVRRHPDAYFPFHPDQLSSRVSHRTALELRILSFQLHVQPSSQGTPVPTDR